MVDSTAAFTGDRLYIVPSDIDLAATEMDIFSRTSRERLLKKALRQVEPVFDYCLIDCPPESRNADHQRTDCRTGGNRADEAGVSLLPGAGRIV